DDIALVALNVLDILDQNRLAALVSVKMGFQRGIATSRLVEHVLDEPLLVAVEGDDADRFGRRLQASDNLGYHGLGFLAVDLGTAALVDAALDVDVTNRSVAGHR